MLKNRFFSIDEKLLKIKSVKMQDVENNVYYFENAIINFKTNEIIGDNVKIDFVKKVLVMNKTIQDLEEIMFLETKIQLLLKKVFLQHVKRMVIVPLGNLRLVKLNMIN